MKLFVSTLLGVFVCLFCLTGGVGAADQSKQMYESEINKMISFYEDRLYLIDSEYKILSDVGKDAQRMLNYLYGKKDALVEEMTRKDLAAQSKKIRSFVVNRARTSEMGLAYTK